MTILQVVQFVAAIIGALACAWWFIAEKRRDRHAPLLLGFWCALLVAFRIGRACLGTHTLNGDNVLLFNALSNWLYLLGAVSIAYIAIMSVIGARKHGNSR